MQTFHDFGSPIVAALPYRGGFMVFTEKAVFFMKPEKKKHKKAKAK